MDRLLAEGATRKAIAEKFGVTVRTAEKWAASLGRTSLADSSLKRSTPFERHEETVRKMFSNGASPMEVARACSVSPETAGRWARRLGFSGFREKALRFWKTPERMVRLRALYAEGCDIPTIVQRLSEEFGESVDESSVANKMRKAGLTLRDQPPAPKPDYLTDRRRAMSAVNRKLRG